MVQLMEVRLTHERQKGQAQHLHKRTENEAFPQYS